MKWCFGIVFNSIDYLSRQIISIKNQEGISTNDYQIIMVGPSTDESSRLISSFRSEGIDISLIPFQDTSEIGWITKKKNLVAYMSKYENLVITHDYVGFCRGWYRNFVEFGEDWEVCMNSIRRDDGRRFRDWITFKEWWGWPLFLPYEVTDQTSKMYVSGTYWCAKKHYMVKNPLNENLRWGQGEDLEWSHRCRHTWNYKINKNSVVKLMKEKLWKGQPDYSPHPDTDPNVDEILASSEVQT